MASDQAVCASPEQELTHAEELQQVAHRLAVQYTLAVSQGRASPEAAFYDLLIRGMLEPGPGLSNV